MWDAAKIWSKMRAIGFGSVKVNVFHRGELVEW